MQFDPANPVINCCTRGIYLEGEGKTGDAMALYQQAWELATNDFEKSTTAHYLARHQKSPADKLRWNRIALDLALNIKDKNVLTMYPSLYLNIAKCYEDMNEHEAAESHYRLALSCSEHLPDDGYGNMIRAGIENGLNRLTNYPDCRTDIQSRK
jgi:rifampin ADP-ribosylating transferase